jgi:hypothetical protein
MWLEKKDILGLLFNTYRIIWSSPVAKADLLPG